MPYPTGHSARTRRTILRSARGLFNRHGYACVTIDQVMSGAGLTRGGFYAHFASKAELFEEAMAFILVEHPARGWDDIDFDMSDQPARKIVEAYLSERHLNSVAESCPLVTHAAEAGRAEERLQSVFQSVLKAMTSVFEVELQGGDKPNQALAVAALCVGGLSLARGVGDPVLARRILEQSRNAALAIGGWSPRTL